MKLGSRGLVLAAIAGLSFGQSRPVSVNVYINDNDDSLQLLGHGTALASGIYKKIGVRLNWRLGEAPTGQPAFGIRTVEHAPASAAPGALAASEPYGAARVIAVYGDRVHRFVDNEPMVAEAAPGYILAHELAHAM
jgi:hypothetical protein